GCIHHFVVHPTSKRSPKRTAGGRRGPRPTARATEPRTRGHSFTVSRRTIAGSTARIARWGLMTAGLGVLASACGGGSQSGAGPSDAGSTGTFAVSNDGSSGQVTFDDAAADVDPSAVYSVTLTTQAFTVPPGGEVYKCQDFANPFQGEPVDITRYDLSMNAGSHHMLLFYKQGATDGPVVDCSGLMVAP